MFTIILILIWVRWCLKKRKAHSNRTEKQELKSAVAFRYEAGLHAQQMPLRSQYPPKSLPSSPLAQRQFVDTTVPFGIQRRHSYDPHSFDPATLDVEMYSREKSESMGSLPYLGLGRMCFQLKYERTTEKLHVKINSIAQLHQRTATPQIFVKIVLMPDKKRKQQTRVVKDVNPEFDEEFVYTAPPDDILNRTLRMTVCTYDRFSRQSVMGYIVFPIIEAKEDLVLDQGTEEIWREITKDDFIVNINISICHFASRVFNRYKTVL